MHAGQVIITAFYEPVPSQERLLYMHKFTNLGFPTLFESSWHRPSFTSLLTVNGIDGTASGFNHAWNLP
jgi:hypothetical protein